MANIQVTTLTVDSIEIDPTGASLNQVLKFNGTKFIASDDATSTAGISYEQVIGDGTNSTFTVSHNLGTKDITVIVRENVNPYDVVNVRWEATTSNTITIDFSAVPLANTKKVIIKGPGTKDFHTETIGNGSNSTITVDHNLGSRDVLAVVRNIDSPYEIVDVLAQATTKNRITLDFSTAPESASLIASVYLLDQYTSYFTIIGDNTNVEYTITHNLGTRDIGVTCRSVDSPYSFSPIRWEALTTNTVKVIFSSPPTTDSKKIGIFVDVGGNKFFNYEVDISMLEDVSVTSPSIGEFLSWDGTNWVNSSAPGGAGITSLDDVPGVTAPSPSSGDFLKWNGTAWVNDAINLGTDTVGSYVQSLVAGAGITLSNNSGEGATPTITIDTSSIQARVANVSDTEIGYLDGVTSAIQTQINDKANSNSSPVITLSGDLSGSATLTNLGNATLNATIVANSVALGTDTTGNYMSDISAGTGIAVSHTPGEGSTATVSIESTAWTSYTPTITADGGGFALNNGTLTGRYKQVGKTVFFKLKFVFGSTTAAGTGHWNFSLPVTAYDSNFTFSAAILDDGVAWYGGIGNGNYTGSTSNFAVIIPSTSASATTWQSVGNGGPFIWGTSDNITITGSYEAA